MAAKILDALTGVINKTASEILDGQVIDKMTGIVATFLKASVEAIRDLTDDEAASEEGSGGTP